MGVGRNRYLAARFLEVPIRESGYDDYERSVTASKDGKEMGCSFSIAKIFRKGFPFFLSLF